MARAGRLYPSLILHGGDQEGRRSAALALASCLLCESAAGCGDCRHCRRIAWPETNKGFHPDFHVLERDLRTATSVDATKAFLRNSFLTPFEARGQVFVVASAETLSGEAANALLKTLEEPPGSTPRHFVLLAPSQFDLLPTLRSRSMSLFLGSAARPGGAAVEQAVEGFHASVVAFLEAADGGELIASAAALKAPWKWDDPRARGPWEGAAAAVMKSAPSFEDAPVRRALLALAADLVEAPRLRLRGIPAERILEGIVSRRLARLVD